MTLSSLLKPTSASVRSMSVFAEEHAEFGVGVRRALLSALLLVGRSSASVVDQPDALGMKFFLAKQAAADPVRANLLRQEGLVGTQITAAEALMHSAMVSATEGVCFKREECSRALHAIESVLGDKIVALSRDKWLFVDGQRTNGILQQFTVANQKPVAEEDFVLFHGSAVHNWLSMLTYGIKDLSGSSLMENGVKHGPGVYFSSNLADARSYAPQMYAQPDELRALGIDHLDWNGEESGRSLQFVGVFEVPRASVKSYVPHQTTEDGIFVAFPEQLVLRMIIVVDGDYALSNHFSTSTVDASDSEKNVWSDSEFRHSLTLESTETKRTNRKISTFGAHNSEVTTDVLSLIFRVHVPEH